jgi:RNA polymerase sigma factor (sigma-70 family)
VSERLLKSPPRQAIEVADAKAVPQRASWATRGLVERIAAGPSGERLRAELASRHRDRSRDEIDDAFQEALKRALVACRAEREYQVYSFLRVTMRNCLSDGRHREAHESVGEDNGPAFRDAIDERLTPEAQLARDEDRVELRELSRSVTGRLSDRQRRVLALRVEGLDVHTIAEREAASRKAIRKDIERIFAVGRDEILRRAGFGCPEGHDLVARYAFRLRADWAAAQMHIAGCERCGRFFVSLDSWRERAATVLPFPAASTVEPGIVGHALERAGDGLAQLRDHATGATGSARQHVSDAVGSAKQHTAGALQRMDPTPLAGARPGAATAAIMGCLAIGGGAATYCIENGVNPIDGLAGVVQAEPGKPGPAEPPKRSESEPAHQPITPPTAVQPPPAAAPPDPVAQPQQPPPPPPPEATPAAVQFGEPASPQPAAPASSEPSSPSPAKPAPMPADGGTDLYGP